MVKKKSQLKTIPRSYLTIGVMSLAINVLFLVALIVGAFLEQKGTFDYAFVNSGIERMCSDDFRKTVEKSANDSGDSTNDKGLRLALIDYPCTQNGAREFYEKGFDEYARSLGLNPGN